MDPFTAMNSFDIIKDKIGMKPVAMAAQIKKSTRYDYRVVKSSPEEGCTLAFYENGEHVGESSFAKKDAAAAGLLNNPMYAKYPEAMYYSRAMSAGVKRYCPDILQGNIYTPEEIQDFEPAAGPFQVGTPSGWKENARKQAEYADQEAASNHQSPQPMPAPEETPAVQTLPPNWRQQFCDLTAVLHMDWKLLEPAQRKEWLHKLLFRDDEEMPANLTHGQWKTCRDALQAYHDAVCTNPVRLTYPYILFPVPAPVRMATGYHPRPVRGKLDHPDHHHTRRRGDGRGTPHAAAHHGRRRSRLNAGP